MLFRYILIKKFTTVHTFFFAQAHLFIGDELVEWGWAGNVKYEFHPANQFH